MAEARNSGGSSVAAPEQRLEAIFREHHPAVASYVLRRARPEAVDDLVAETFLVAWRRLDDVPADALPWLLGVARNVLATHHRALRRREALASRLRENGEAFSQAHSEIPLGERRAVAETLERLPEKDREAIMLVAWDGLTPSQAAAALGQSPVSFRVRLHRAKRRLRRELDRDARMNTGVQLTAVAREAFHD